MGPAAERQRWSPRQSALRRRVHESLRGRGTSFAAIMDYPAIGPGLVGLGSALPAPDEAVGLHVLPDHALIGLRVDYALVLEIEDVILAGDGSADEIEIAILIIDPVLPPL